MQGISYTPNDEVTVTVKPDSLVVSKKGDNKSATIPLKKMTEADWKQACFAVCLGGNGDKIEIINSG